MGCPETFLVFVPLCLRSFSSFGLPRDVLYDLLRPAHCSFSTSPSIFGLACISSESSLAHLSISSSTPSSDTLFLSSPGFFGLPRDVFHALPTALFLTAPLSLIFASAFWPKASFTNTLRPTPVALFKQCLYALRALIFVCGLVTTFACVSSVL